MQGCVKRDLSVDILALCYLEKHRLLVRLLWHIDPVCMHCMGGMRRCKLRCEAASCANLKSRAQRGVAGPAAWIGRQTVSPLPCRLARAAADLATLTCTSLEGVSKRESKICWHSIFTWISK